MGRIREDFYRKIQMDYRLFESDSVIFQFFREEHERMYRQFLEKKKDESLQAQGSYLLRLQEQRELLQEGKESPEVFVRQLFLILNGRRALYQDSLGTENTPGDFLKPLIAVCLGVEEKELRGRMQRYIGELTISWEKEEEKIRERLNQSSFAMPPCGQLLEIAETVMERATHMEIREFFYDAGYPLTEEGKKIPARRMDKMLCLLEAYCEKKGYALFDDRKRFSNKDCDILINGLNGGVSRKDIFFPLKVDARTGCALYIIGRDLYQRNYPLDPEREERGRDMDREVNVWGEGRTENVHGMDRTGNAWSAEKTGNVRGADRVGISRSAGGGQESVRRARPERVCCYGVLRMSTDVEAGTVGYVLDDGDAYGSLELAQNAYREACDEAWEEICENFRRRMPPGCPQAFREHFRSGYGADPEEITEIRQETEREFRRKEAEDRSAQQDPKKKLLHGLAGRR